MKNKIKTVDDVRGAVNKIRLSASEDDELAHSREDDLFLGVLRAIAAGAADAQGLAREALKSSRIHFSRWAD